MIDCEEVVENLFTYLDNEMDATNIAAVKAHLDLCRACFDRVEFERVIRIEIREKTHHLCPEEVKKRIAKIVENF